MQILFRKDEDLEEFSDFSWLVRARGGDASMYQLSLIKAQDGFVFATDGRRLHVLVNDQLSPGMYRVSVDDPDQVVLYPAPIFKFPDCISIFGKRHAPVWTGKRHYYNESNYNNVENILYQLIRHMPPGTGPRIGLMADAVRTETRVSWTAHVAPNGVIHLESERRFVAIMPMELIP